MEPSTLAGVPEFNKVSTQDVTAARLTEQLAQADIEGRPKQKTIMYDSAARRVVEGNQLPEVPFGNQDFNIADLA